MEVVDRGRHQANIVFDAFKFIEGALKELNVACCAAVPYHVPPPPHHQELLMFPVSIIFNA